MTMMTRMPPGALALALGLAACGGATGEPAGFAERADKDENAAAEGDEPRGAAAATAMLEKTREQADGREGVATAKAEASAFIDMLYQGYARNEPLDLFGEPRKVFEPVLASAVAKTVARELESGDMPDLLSADPICGCQDWSEFSHRIDTLTVTDDRATAKLTVRNFGESAQRTIDLLKTPAGWRIYDIDGDFRAAAMGS
jgi:hypothetical protein